MYELDVWSDISKNLEKLTAALMSQNTVRLPMSLTNLPIKITRKKKINEDIIQHSRIKRKQNEEIIQHSNVTTNQPGTRYQQAIWYYAVEN